jgi:branched-chain amino acid transport system substrate-binding protein
VLQGGTGGTTDTSAAAAPKLVADAADPKGDGKAQCSGVSLAYAGTINGDNAALGQNILYGADVAVKLHNQANPGCQVELQQFDTEGKADKAPGIVTQIINEPKIISVVGLSFSGESKSTRNLFNHANLVQISPSATNSLLSENGWKTFFRGMGSDAVQGPAVATFLTGTVRASKVCVISDDTPYGTGLAQAVIGALTAKASCTDKVRQKQTDFSAVVDKMVTEKPDTIFYSGYYPQAGPFAQQLDNKGVTAKFVGSDGVKNTEFVKAAGNAASKAYFTCPCAPEGNFKDFTAAYKSIEGHDPGTYSTEAYDVATILLKGIGKGVTDRAGLLDFVRNYNGRGLTKTFKWNDKGELSETPVWSYQVENDKIVNKGQIS